MDILLLFSEFLLVLICRIVLYTTDRWQGLAKLRSYCFLIRNNNFKALHKLFNT